MICLKEIDLTEAKKQKQKIITIEEELKSVLRKEQDKLRNMLVFFNLDYYGTSPSKYYKNIKKEYLTDDGYSVKIKQGLISITKRIKKNLFTALWFYFVQVITIKDDTREF